MPEERDPLELLASSWKELVAPSPDRDLDGEDEATRRAVLWMAQAWSTLQAPDFAAPRRGRLLRFRRRFLRPAVAAALLLAALGMLFLPKRPSDSRSAAEIAVRAPKPPEPRPVLLPDSRPGRVEFRSGPVRLILLQPEPNPKTLPENR
ncbi:MAG: hypothetical protein ACE5H3_08795 [Planctomycetota bacterium]